MRTENDTWDITTSVGSTALFVAAARAVEAQEPNPAAVDPFAEVFCRAVGGEWADLLDGKAPDHALRTEFRRSLRELPGRSDQVFDTYFGKAAAAGVRQIVLLAAGLDSRAYRLPWPDETVVFELDQPQVLEFKRDALAGLRPKARRREIAVDLRNDWPQALRHSGFDPSKPSAWIVEGLLIYLPAVVQAELFAGIDLLAAAGSHAAIEESAPMRSDVFAAKVEAERTSGAAASTRGGPFFQLVYNQQHAPAAEWFGHRGWRTESTTLPDCLRAQGRPVPSADSESGSMTGSISLVSAVKG